MDKCICIHGHFYQPPRENPWLEAIEQQDSAYPYHDWNDRITAECYAPNATARLLDDQARIARIVNNYAKISFNFGPTLLAWLEAKAPDIHAAIVEADKQSLERFSGHGSAQAQAFNHMIMPLANRRDKRTQALWGVKDFEHRFGRKPEGMWLPETAADTETLVVLAELGIKFTIMSPYQAAKVRRIGGRTWRDVNGGRVDPSMPYEIKLPGGKKIAVFFYDGPISQGVAFERLLTDGRRFSDRLAEAFDDSRGRDQLVHIATDGESYGHHHRQGEMALAYALELLEEDPNVRLTNYGEYLEKHPAMHEAQIHEGSAWSCSHGVARWRTNCGCNSGGRPSWNQNWRGPLRTALDWLRDELAPRYEAKAKQFLKDPWMARDAYISVILDRSPGSLDRFFAEHFNRPLAPSAETGNGQELDDQERVKREQDDKDRLTVLKLLELQRHAMLMYTSCGWFFDELSGIETVQVILYAGRAIQLAQDVLGEDLEAPFLERLEHAKSNLREHGDGRKIYQKWVKPAMVNFDRVAAHYAVTSIFETQPKEGRIYSYAFDQEDRLVLTAGAHTLAVGRTRMKFRITQESAVFTYGVLHFGDHNLNGGVRVYQGEEAYELIKKEMSEAFNRADFPEVLRLMDRHFGESYYSLKSLFRDEQRRILAEILKGTRSDLEVLYRQVTDRYIPLMRFIGSLGVPLPKGLNLAADFVMSGELQRRLQEEDVDIERVRSLVADAEAGRVELDLGAIQFDLKERMEMLMETFRRSPDDQGALAKLDHVATVLHIVPCEVNLWKPQNHYYELLCERFPMMKDTARSGDQQAQEWVNAFTSLGEKLGFYVPGDAPGEDAA